MTTEQTAQQLELAAQIIRTGHPWGYRQDKGPITSYKSPLEVIQDGNVLIPLLVIPPDNRPLHNPDNLIAEQVGVGWRLTVSDEIATNKEYWHKTERRWYSSSFYDETVTYRLPLSVPWPEAKPDPYAELKKAHAEGKVIQQLSGGVWYDFKTNPCWSEPPNEYRIKPDTQPFQLPPPPPGMQWHRTDGWQEGDLPQGWRPYVQGETLQKCDEWKQHLDKKWQIVDLEDTGIGHEPDTSHPFRTIRPLTFTHAGKTWTYHRPGDPMPCDGNRRVFWLYQICDEYSESTEDTASHREWDWSRIIGWRYADEKKTVPFDISDVPPCSVLSLHPPRWFDIYGVCKEGIYVLDDEPLVETLWNWDYLAEKVKINRSIPLTGKWNPDAWEPCHKLLNENG